MRQMRNWSSSCRAVSERAAQTLKWAEQNDSALLDIALDHLTLGRAALYAAILDPQSADPRSRNPKSTQAVDGLRRAGQQNIFPAASSPAPGCGFSTARRPAGAQTDLDEAWEIAERGPMRAVPGRHPPPPRPPLPRGDAVSVGQGEQGSRTGRKTTSPTPAS